MVSVSANIYGQVVAGVVPGKRGDHVRWGEDNERFLVPSNEYVGRSAIQSASRTAGPFSDWE
jgi:hypothetical protein